MKEFAYDNSRFYERENFSKRVKNNVRKGENAPFSRCFKKTCTADK